MRRTEEQLQRVGFLCISIVIDDYKSLLGSAIYTGKANIERKQRSKERGKTNSNKL